MKGLLAVAITLGALALSPATGQAYDDAQTHRWLTRQAVETLVATYPGRYDELLDYIDEVVDGSEQEDDYFLDGDGDPTTLRLQRHFYRPTDGAGLTMSGRTFISSYQWGALPNDINVWGWDDALAAFQSGDRRTAYLALGHVVHLIQDLTVPAHTHLDIHGPPSGDDYEGYCTSQMLDDRNSRLPLPAADALVPGFESLYHAWQATAYASYRRNLYRGDLSDTAAATGTLAEMFPDLSWSWFSEKWTIGTPSVGELGSDFVEAEPGYYYVKNAEYPAAVDVSTYDLYDPTRTRYAANTAGAPMVELFARDLVPVAILHSAAVMKMFADAAEDLDADPDNPMEPTDPGAAGCNAGGSQGSAPFVFVFVIIFVFRRRNSCARSSRP